MKTIAIYGGSFDPVTWGHVIAVVNFFLTNPILDEVLVVPCFKQRGKNLIAFEHRYKMCQLAFQSLNKVIVSDVERMLGGESYTYCLVQHLKEQDPKSNFRFIMGADLKDSYKKWEKVSVIDELAPPLIVPRPGFSTSENEAGSFVNVSSTQVRDCLKSTKSSFLERALPEPVLSYIKSNKLYI